eukprot:4886904-Pyramimonas_sp.AAC.1
MVMAEVADHSGEHISPGDQSISPRKLGGQCSARRRGSPPSGRRLVHASYHWPLQARSFWPAEPLPTGHYSDGRD